MENLGIQLYSLGFDNHDPMPESFQKLAAMGYKEVEFAGSNYGGMSVEEMKQALEAAGLKAVSSHVSMDNMEKDIPYVAAIGGKMIICPMFDFANKEEALELAKLLNKYGKLAKEHGLMIGYHNHTQEFNKDDGKYLMDYLIENTDPEYVGFELDCGWCSNAGQDPVEYLNKYAGRFMAIHIKENNAVSGPRKATSMYEEKKPFRFEIGPDGKPIFPPEMLKFMEENQKLNSATGRGIVDWKAVKAAAEAQSKGEMHFFVEREANYAPDKNRLTCLSEDAAWLIKNL